MRVRYWFVSSSVFLTLLAMMGGCRPKTKILKSPPGYNFSVKLEDKLDPRLKEISGIIWDNKNDEFIAHQDENGILFYLEREMKVIKKTFPFDTRKGDYEDIALVNEVVYVLKSDGSLTKVYTDSTGKQYGLEAGKISLAGLNDFESLYYDPARKAVIMICKNCASDDKKSVSAYAYYPDSIGFDNKPVYVINADKVRQLSPQKTSKFQPSAARIHPKTNKLFILSSASNQLVIADLNGNVEGVYWLAKKMFPQPEGLTFKSSGDMYISNEGVTSRSTLYKFVYTASPLPAGSTPKKPDSITVEPDSSSIK
jgi:uncharacterized protein YjiK